MQLGMFFVGASPGGGASNLWTLLLGGNINLSIIMTSVSTIMAFVMMPLWIFTLGRLIFNSGSLDIPYTQILSYVVGLIVPLGIGYLCQRYAPKVAEVLKRIMKMMSAILLVFIIVFAIVTNLYLFELFSWEVSHKNHIVSSITTKKSSINLFISHLLLKSIWLFGKLHLPYENSFLLYQSPSSIFRSTPFSDALRIPVQDLFQLLVW